MTLTDEQLREWRASLDKVTPGPWQRLSGRGIMSLTGWLVYPEARLIPVDEEHLARCDPQTIGPLIDEVLHWRGGMLKLSGERTQIIRNAALEEAASVARKVPLAAAQVIADAILALKTPEREE